MLLRLHAKFFHYGYEFPAIMLGIGREHRQVTKETYVIGALQLVYVHACQAGYPVEIIVAPPVGIAVGLRTDQAWMCYVKFVIGLGSLARGSGFHHEFSGSHDWILRPGARLVDRWSVFQFPVR